MYWHLLGTLSNFLPLLASSDSDRPSRACMCIPFCRTWRAFNSQVGYHHIWWLRLYLSLLFQVFLALVGRALLCRIFPIARYTLDFLVGAAFPSVIQCPCWGLHWGLQLGISVVTIFVAILVTLWPRHTFGCMLGLVLVWWFAPRLFPGVFWCCSDFIDLLVICDSFSSVPHLFESLWLSRRFFTGSL